MERRNLIRWAVACGLMGMTVAGKAQDVPSLVNQEWAGWVTTYRELHSAAELSHHEAKTSEMLAAELLATPIIVVT